MGIEALQSYLEFECKDANLSVDVGKIVKEVAAAAADASTGENPPSGRFSLVIDAEGCLDRLYGGHHADWSSGGQWNRMYEFLSALNTACNKINVKLVVFISGASEKSRLGQWAANQVLGW